MEAPLSILRVPKMWAMELASNSLGVNVYRVLIASQRVVLVRPESVQDWERKPKLAKPDVDLFLDLHRMLARRRLLEAQAQLQRWLRARQPRARRLREVRLSTLQVPKMWGMGKVLNS